MICAAASTKGGIAVCWASAVSRQIRSSNADTSDASASGWVELSTRLARRRRQNVDIRHSGRNNIVRDVRLRACHQRRRGLHRSLTKQRSGAGCFDVRGRGVLRGEGSMPVGLDLLVRLGDSFGLGLDRMSLPAPDVARIGRRSGQRRRSRWSRLLRGADDCANFRARRHRLPRPGERRRVPGR